MFKVKNKDPTGKCQLGYIFLIFKALPDMLKVNNRT